MCYRRDTIAVDAEPGGERVVGPARRGDVAPALFVIDHDPISLDMLLSGLLRRFGKDFMVRGESSPEMALASLEELAAEEQPVALLIVEGAALGILACAHNLHPSAKRVLLVDRDYSSTSPAVQAIMLGRADYDIARPWADAETMYLGTSEDV